MIYKRLLKYIIWIIGLVLICVIVFSVLSPKYYFVDEASKSPETENWKDFYSLTDEILDMVFVGSSHVYSGVNTMEIYKNTGWRAFDMSSSSQDMMVSYYYLKEMYRNQSPRYVIIDTYGMLYETECDYSITVRAFNNMSTFSKVRVEAIDDYVESHMDNGINYKVNMMFPFINAHSRWDELTNIDFNPNEYDTSEMGFIMYTGHSERGEKSEYFVENNNEDISEYAKKYFDKIYQLCKENNSQIVMITIPYDGFNSSNADTLMKFANEYGVEYINYGDPSSCENIGLSDVSDWKNMNHLNWRGSKKLTNYLITDFISRGYIVYQTPDERMSELEVKYDDMVISNDLESSYTLEEYMEMLRSYENSVVISAYRNDDSKKTTKVSGYVYDKGFNIEDVQGQSIVINDTDYNVGGKGVGFVVISKRTGDVLDAVQFDSTNHYNR